MNHQNFNMKNIKSNIAILENVINISMIKDISAYSRLTDEFIEEYKDYLDWNYISLYKKFDQTFYDRFKERLIPILVCKNNYARLKKKIIYM